MQYLQNLQSFYLAPGNLDLVLVRGPDAGKFLQGQLTCDVLSLADDTFTYGAACNNKGRIYATFTLVRQADRYYIVFNKGLGAVFAAALQKYLPFYKCTLEQNPSEWSCLALAGIAAGQALTTSGLLQTLPAEKACAPLASGWICQLSPERFVLCASAEIHARLQQAVSAHVPVAGPATWQLGELLSGHFPFTPADIEKFTPQELQLDTHGYVSFSKGCYTGQEIVARMHYRGKVKKQLYLLRTDTHSAEMLAAGFDILDEQDHVLGHTLKQLLADTGTLYALAHLPAELAEHPMPLHAAGGSPLTLQAF